MIPKGWTHQTIDDLIRFEGGSQPPKSCFINEPRDGYVRLIQIRDYRTDKYPTYIPKNLARKFCNKDEVMIGRYGPPLFQIFRGLVGAYNVALMKAVPRKELLREYMYYFLSQDSISQYLENLSQRTGGQAGVEMDKLKKFLFLLPPIGEQKKIAEILFIWDEAIAKTGRLLDCLWERKKGLMQQLLTGKLRFSGFTKKWNEYKLGSVLDERIERGVEGLPLLSVTENGITYRDEQGRRDNSNEDKSKYLRICPGDIGYNTMRMWQGRSAISKYEGIVSPAYTVLIPKKTVDVRFIAHLFKFQPMVHTFYRYSQGLVSDTWSLKYPVFAKIHVKIPELEEQKRIADVLEACDKEINETWAYYEKLQEQKKGLMQNLFSGQVMVKV